MLRYYTGLPSLFDGAFERSLARSLRALEDPFFTNPRLMAREAPVTPIQHSAGPVELVVDLERHGIKPEELSIQVTDDGVLQVGGEHQEEERDASGKVIGRSYRSYQRAMPLARGVTAADVKAKLEEGKLKIAWDGKVPEAVDPNKVLVEGMPEVKKRRKLKNKAETE